MGEDMVASSELKVGVLGRVRSVCTELLVSQ